MGNLSLKLEKQMPRQKSRPRPGAGSQIARHVDDTMGSGRGVWTHTFGQGDPKISKRTRSLQVEL